MKHLTFEDLAEFYTYVDSNLRGAREYLSSAVAVRDLVPEAVGPASQRCEDLAERLARIKAAMREKSTTPTERSTP